MDTIYSQFNKWCEDAGGNIEIEFVLKEPRVAPTAIDETNPYWTAFKNTLVDEL